MGEPVWVGIDLGTQSVRAIALGDDGTVLAGASHPLTSHRSGIVHEQNPHEWWAAVVATLVEVTSELGRERTVTALAISATSGTVLVTDESGTPTTPGIMYDDARGAASVDRVNEFGGSVWSRLGYRMQGSWALPTLLWVQEHGGLEPGRSIAHQPDVITARLAGRRVPSDSSHALKTGIDLDTLEWPEEVLTALGFPRAALPRVVASGTVLATVCRAAAAETGLPEGCAIVGGMTDGCAAQLAAGALTPGSWNSVLGTTLVMKGMSSERLVDPTGAVYAHRAPFGIGWFPGGASSTGAGAISHWLPGRDLAAVTRDAASITASTAPPVSYPLVGRGERFPFVAPEAHALFDGRPSPAGADGSTFTAIAYGVAYVERLSYDLLDLVGYDLTGELSLTGGGARNDWWNRLRCDVLQRSARIPVDGEGAIGMAVLAAAAMDEATPASERLGVAASGLLVDPPSIEPRTERARGLLDGYRSFLDALVSKGWLGDELAESAAARAV